MGACLAFGLSSRRGSGIGATLVVRGGRGAVTSGVSVIRTALAFRQVLATAFVAVRALLILPRKVRGDDAGRAA